VRIDRNHLKRARDEKKLTQADMIAQLEAGLKNKLLFRRNSKELPTKEIAVAVKTPATL
jgi:DNA-binding XRE family transcriptional regulator